MGACQTQVTGQQCVWVPLRSRALWTARGSECWGRLNTLAFLLFPFREASQTALGVGVGVGTWVSRRPTCPLKALEGTQDKEQAGLILPKSGSKITVSLQDSSESVSPWVL